MNTSDNNSPVDESPGHEIPAQESLEKKSPAKNVISPFAHNHEIPEQDRNKRMVGGMLERSQMLNQQLIAR